MHHRTALIALSVLSLGLAGCPQDPRQRAASDAAAKRSMPKPIEPVRPPPPKDVPIDPALQQAARQELLQGLEAVDPTTRLHALEAMKEVAPTEARAKVLNALSDADPKMRFAGAMAAGELGLADARPRLGELLHDADPNLRIAVRFALHRLGDTTNSHDLELTAIDPASATARFTTAMVLGRMGEQSAKKILRVLRNDRHPAVRQQASESLYRLGDEQGLSDLIGLTASPMPGDMMVGLLALAVRRDSRVTEHVRAGLTAEARSPGETMETRLVAARAMGMVARRPNGPYDLGYVIAMEGARSNDPRHRHLASLALGAIGRSDAQDVLAKLLKDREQAVRVAAATALLEVGNAAAK